MSMSAQFNCIPLKCYISNQNYLVVLVCRSLSVTLRMVSVTPKCSCWRNWHMGTPFRALPSSLTNTGGRGSDHVIHTYCYINCHCIIAVQYWWSLAATQVLLCMETLGSRLAFDLQTLTFSLLWWHSIISLCYYFDLWLIRMTPWCNCTGWARESEADWNWTGHNPTLNILPSIHEHSWTNGKVRTCTSELLAHTLQGGVICFWMFSLLLQSFAEDCHLHQH